MTAFRQDPQPTARTTLDATLNRNGLGIRCAQNQVCSESGVLRIRCAHFQRSRRHALCGLPSRAPWLKVTLIESRARVVERNDRSK